MSGFMLGGCRATPALMSYNIASRGSCLTAGGTGNLRSESGTEAGRPAPARSQTWERALLGAQAGATEGSALPLIRVLSVCNSLAPRSLWN